MLNKKAIARVHLKLPNLTIDNRYHGLYIHDIVL